MIQTSPRDVSGPVMFGALCEVQSPFVPPASPEELDEAADVRFTGSSEIHLMPLDCVDTFDQF